MNNFLFLIFTLGLFLPKVSEASSLFKRKKNVDQMLFNTNALSIKLPTSDNTIKNVLKKKLVSKNNLEKMSLGTTPFLDNETYNFLLKFIDFKKKWGTDQEKNLYEKMSRKSLIKRLLIKRPYSFYNSEDKSLLRSGKKQLGGFTQIQDKDLEEELNINDYITYDEMLLSALIGVYTPTPFINSGDRYNNALSQGAGTFESQGVLVGLVGPRFEVGGRMESSLMSFHPFTNTIENGYGVIDHDLALDEKKLKLKHWNTMWARFYGLEYLPTYEQASEGPDDYIHFEPCHTIFPCKLHKAMYKKRIKLIIAPFLALVQKQAKQEKKKVYLRLNGVGLGVWRLAKDPLHQQEQLYLEAVAEVLSTNHFKNITDIHFAWFSDKADLIQKDLIFSMNPQLNYSFGKKDLAEKLIGNDQGKLLVSTYAWDGNSMPGNEYWSGHLSSSDDAAAASCSLIAQLQNPYINEAMLENITIIQSIK